jgi:hypothetical protein
MKTFRSMLLVLAIPASLAAQQPAGPMVDPMTTTFKNRMAGQHRNLAAAFDSIPESLYGYKPTAKQLTIGYIAQHLASDSYFFCGNFGDTKPTLAAEDTATADSVKATWPKAKLVEKLKASFAYCESAIAQVNDSKVPEMISVSGPNGTTRQVPRIQYLIGHVADMADHYSQISNYMRLNNILPPTALPRPGRGGN